MSSPPRNDKPDADFLEALLECETLARELRDKLAELMHLSPKSPPAWFGTFTDAAVCKGLGALLMTTTKGAAWVTLAVQQAVGVLNSTLPSEGPTLTEHVVSGQADAEMSCPCGDCVPCALRNQHGVEKAREMVAADLGRATRKEHRKLVDPRGQPYH